MVHRRLSNCFSKMVHRRLSKCFSKMVHRRLSKCFSKMVHRRSLNRTPFYYCIKIMYDHMNLTSIKLFDCVSLGVNVSHYPVVTEPPEPKRTEGAGGLALIVCVIVAAVLVLGVVLVWFRYRHQGMLLINTFLNS